MGKIMTRMGSGFPIEMSESQLMEDLTAGTEDAADRGKISPLSKEELDYYWISQVSKCTISPTIIYLIS